MDYEVPDCILFALDETGRFVIMEWWMKSDVDCEHISSHVACGTVGPVEFDFRSVFHGTWLFEITADPP